MSVVANAGAASHVARVAHARRQEQAMTQVPPKQSVQPPHEHDEIVGWCFGAVFIAAGLLMNYLAYRRATSDEIRFHW